MLKFEIYKLIWLIIVIKPITNCVGEGTQRTVVSLDFVVFYKASSEKIEYDIACVCVSMVS